MTIAERIPVLTDAELANLNANAKRLSETGTPAQRAAAADLMPLIEAQIADHQDVALVIDRNLPRRFAIDPRALACTLGALGLEHV